MALPPGRRGKCVGTGGGGESGGQPEIEVSAWKETHMLNKINFL